MDLLTPDTGLIFWTVLTFLLLLFVLKKFAWKPLLRMLDEREQRIKDSLEKAEQAQREAESTLGAYQKMLNQARREAQEIIEKSQKAAEANRQEILQQAQRESELLLERAKREIALGKEKALDEIKQFAVDLSLTIASKIIGQSLTKEAHLHIIEQSLAELDKLGN
ncbi:MAG: F0F1 ATP synthase subunit B [candidate division KSB1 bacterium]|nr:F0F1 ATP synthase subunit B [candidate division KSB1 bacterium]